METTYYRPKCMRNKRNGKKFRTCRVQSNIQSKADDAFLSLQWFIQNVAWNRKTTIKQNRWGGTKAANGMGSRVDISLFTKKKNLCKNKDTQIEIIHFSDKIAQHIIWISMVVMVCLPSSIPSIFCNAQTTIHQVKIVTDFSKTPTKHNNWCKMQHKRRNEIIYD